MSHEYFFHVSVFSTWKFFTRENVVMWGYCHSIDFFTWKIFTWPSFNVNNLFMCKFGKWKVWPSEIFGQVKNFCYVDNFSMRENFSMCNLCHVKNFSKLKRFPHAIFATWRILTSEQLFQLKIWLMLKIYSSEKFCHVKYLKMW